MKRQLITERDIQLAAKAGKTTLDTGSAVVTPSARDLARRLRLTLSETADSGSGSAPSGGSAPRSGGPARSAGGSDRTVTVALGADHGGVALKTAIAARLRELGHHVMDVGTEGSDPVDYPDFAVAVARLVSSGRAAFGIMVDGAGIGSCMAANKIRGVRAAMCYDVTTAMNAREHNDANVLTLGGGLVGTRLALEVVEKFLRTPFGGGRHERRVAKIRALDEQDGAIDAAPRRA